MKFGLEKINTPVNSDSNFEKMYEIDENNPVSEYEIQRYKHSKEKYFDILKKIEEISQLDASMPEDKMVEFILEKLYEPNQGIQSAAFRLTQSDFITDEGKVILIPYGLNHSNIEVQREACELLGGYRGANFIPLEKREELHQKAFQLIKKIILNNNPDELEFIQEMIYTLPSGQKELWDLLTEQSKAGLLSEDSNTREISTKNLILSAEKGDRTALVVEGLKNLHSDIQHISAKMIEYIPDEDRLDILPQCLEHINQNVQVAAIKSTLGAMISFLSNEQKVDIVLKGMNHKNKDVQLLCAKYGERLGLHKTMPEFNSWIVGLVMNGFDGNDSQQKQFASDLISYAPEDEKSTLFDLAIKKGLGRYLIDSPLYKSNAISSDKFSRKVFMNKKDSGSILFGGNLKGKTILRRINRLEALVAWQKAYESYSTWKDAGFDYVPIEPIQSFNIADDGVASVYAGILDINVTEWYSKTNLFKDEISEQIANIQATLKENGISHNDDDDRNFCLRFSRNDDEEPDFSADAVPRVYIIDFEFASLKN